MKRKHLPVILFSTAIIVVAFFSSLLGFGLYTQFKRAAFAASYRESIQRITADIFREDLSFSNVEVGMPEGNDAGPVFEATLRNNTGRTVTSLLIELYFSDIDGKVLYKEWINPLRGHSFDGALFSSHSPPQGVVIPPGESFSFRHVMRNCPEYIVRRMAIRRGFARRDTSKDVNFSYSVDALKIL